MSSCKINSDISELVTARPMKHGDSLHSAPEGYLPTMPDQSLIDVAVSVGLARVVEATGPSGLAG